MPNSTYGEHAGTHMHTVFRHIVYTRSIMILSLEAQIGVYTVGPRKFSSSGSNLMGNIWVGFDALAVTTVL